MYYDSNKTSIAILHTNLNELRCSQWKLLLVVFVRNANIFHVVDERL